MPLTSIYETFLETRLTISKFFALGQSDRDDAKINYMGSFSSLLVSSRMSFISTAFKEGMLILLL